MLECLLAGSRSVCTDKQLSPNIGFLKMGSWYHFYSEEQVAIVYNARCRLQVQTRTSGDVAALRHVIIIA